jgi:hypothetical protein
VLDVLRGAKSSSFAEEFKTQGRTRWGRFAITCRNFGPLTKFENEVQHFKNYFYRHTIRRVVASEVFIDRRGREIGH